MSCLARSWGFDRVAALVLLGQCQQRRDGSQGVGDDAVEPGDAGSAAPRAVALIAASWVGHVLLPGLPEIIGRIARDGMCVGLPHQAGPGQ